MNTLPILNSSNANTPIFIYKDKVITHKQFKQDVLIVAESLQQHKYTIILCDDRYLFALTFAANILHGSICLLPANHIENDLNQIEKDYPDTQRLDNDAVESFLKKKKTQNLSFPSEIDDDQLVAIVFTSGSSGKPKANKKLWGSLFDSAQRVAAELNLNKQTQHHLVATVPPQHMYGFETTIIFPLVNSVCVYSGKPFFPEDVRQTLESTTKPSILITTPIHLRACTKANLEWPEIDFVLCATAPLSQQLAQEVEQQLNTTVREIYGCSEAGVIATRAPTQNLDWTLLNGYTFSEKFTGTCLLTPATDEEILLPDQIEQVDSEHFHLLGRQSDIIKIAGKRGSLNDLKIKLCALDGVDDAVFFMPTENPDEKARLAAFVVAQDLNIKEISYLFSEQIDHAFMPRPLIKIDKLPYNETGKLPHKNLISLFKQLRTSKHLKDSA